MSHAIPSAARPLRDAVRRLIVTHGTLEEARRPCGAELSLPHAYALLELRNHGEPMTVSELAARLCIDRTNVSRLCARMEAAGELKRRTHPEDARARALCLTKKGLRIADNVDASSARHFSRIVDRLGDSTATIIEALELLEHTLAQLEEQT